MRVDVYYRWYTQTEVQFVQNSELNGYHHDSVSGKRKGFLAIEAFQIQNQFSVPDPTSDMIGVSSHSYQPCLFLALAQMLDSQLQCGRILPPKVGSQRFAKKQIILQSRISIFFGVAIVH